MTGKEGYSRFVGIGFEDFRRLALDGKLSPYEKIGFPDAYRKGFEPSIHRDIVAKVPPLATEGATVLDVGPGCTDLPKMIIADAQRLGQDLYLVDSSEMLSLLPDSPCTTKIAASFPDCPALLEELGGKVDAIIAYSLLHYVFVENNSWGFLDAMLSLLAPHGHLLIGDIPNVSMRKRFLDSDAGKAFHRSFTGTDTPPVVTHHTIEAGTIDDSVIFSLMQRARAAGFHAFVLPQPIGLPMHNRREDLLVVRP
jgi:SAM-dependent methyltransferase